MKISNSGHGTVRFVPLHIEAGFINLDFQLMNFEFFIKKVLTYYNLFVINIMTLFVRGVFCAQNDFLQERIKFRV